MEWEQQILQASLPKVQKTVEEVAQETVTMAITQAKEDLQIPLQIEDSNM